MPTFATQDAGTIEATRTLAGFDLNVKNADGETIATVVVSDRKAWDLFKTLGEELNA